MSDPFPSFDQSFIDFDDTVGTSKHVIKLPYVVPETIEHHQINNRHLEQKLNALPLSTTYMYQNREPITLQSGVLIQLPKIKIPAGGQAVDISVTANAAMGDTIISYDLTVDGQPRQEFPFNNSSTRGIGTDVLEVFNTGFWLYDSVTLSGVSLQVDSGLGGDITASWLIIIHPVKVYQY